MKWWKAGLMMTSAMVAGSAFAAVTGTPLHPARTAMFDGIGLAGIWVLMYVAHLIDRRDRRNGSGMR